ncbi:MAG: hypothetical protein HY318_03655, partial [Armatimonadetes bacterium]|nr:hypothetical protein [Armatimonadota bacterium]
MKTFGSTTEVCLLIIVVCMLVSSAPASTTLNNFVTDLLNLRIKPTHPLKECTFTNPRSGWVFVASTAKVKGFDKIRISFDSAGEETTVILHEKGRAETLEAMRLLPAGEYRIRIHAEGKALLKSLVVRAIPEIGWVTLQNWEFMQKNRVQDDVNLMVDYGRERQPEHEQYKQPWTEAGKQWLVMCKVPGFTTDKSVALPDSHKYWSEVMSQNPKATGFIADEIAAAQPGYEKSFPIWAEAIRKLKKEHPDRNAYLYCCGPILTEA